MLGQDGRAPDATSQNATSAVSPHGRTSGVAILTLAALVIAVLSSAVGVAALRTDPAAAHTVLQRGAGAILTLSDGQRRLAVEGELVPSGATVLAGRSGAVLSTTGREVHLYPAASVTVLDGLRQVLRAGSVVVDSSGALGLDLDTPAAAVAARDGALVRVDGGPLTRVGVLRTRNDGEPGADVRATGRQAVTEVPEYYQVQVATGGLPGSNSPLLLTGDAYELALARDLVLADRMFNEIRRTLISDGTEGGIVLAALRTAVPDVGLVAAAAPDTERALGYLIATAHSGGSEAERFLRVRELRSAGGSWGVVAAIVGSTVDRMGARLDQLLAPAATVLAVAQQQPAPGDRMGLVLPVPTTTPPALAGPPATGLRPPGATSGGGRPAAPSTRPSPTPSPAPPAADPLRSPLPALPFTPPDPVTDVVDTLLEIVDLEAPRVPAPPAPAPSPTPSPAPPPLPLKLELPLLR